MEIDPHNLPAEVNLLQQIVLQLLQAVEDKDQLVALWFAKTPAGSGINDIAAVASAGVLV